MTHILRRNLQDLLCARRGFVLLQVGLAIALCACGAVGSRYPSPGARAAGGLPMYRPVPLREMAYQGPRTAANAARPERRGAPAALDGFLKQSTSPMKAEPRRPVLIARVIPASPRPRPGVDRTHEVLLANAAAGGAFAPHTASQPERAVPRVTASTSDAQKYAVRETRSQAQQKYRGGDAVVITASTLVIVLLVVLLVLLVVH